MSSIPLLRLPIEWIIQVIRSMEVRNLFGFSFLSKTAKPLKSHPIIHHNMSSFSLLRLPSHAIIQVIRSMEIIDILIFSLLSKASKSIVKSIGIKARSTLLQTGMDLSIRFHFDCHVLFITINQKTNMIDATCHFTKTWALRSSRWKVDQFELKKFIMHCMVIFNFYRIETLLIIRNHLSLDVIKHELEGLEIRKLAIPEPILIENGHKMMEQIKYTSLSMFQTNETCLPNILVQNLDVLLIESVPFLKLHHLLSSNCSEMKMIRTGLTEKDMNKFIKLWIKGSNRRLRYLYLGGEGTLTENGVLKGVRYKRMALEETRFFYRSKDAGNDRVKKVTNGYDVTRSDGAKGTIQIDGTSIAMELICWI